MEKNKKALQYSALFGVVGGLIYLVKTTGKSFIEEKARDRIFATIKSMLIMTAYWIVVILIVIGLGVFFNMENITTWIIDFILITYMIQGIIGVVSALRTIQEYKDGFWSGMAINIFSISITSNAL